MLRDECAVHHMLPGIVLSGQSPDGKGCPLAFKGLLRTDRLAAERVFSRQRIAQAP
jgi:hypothetical protein